MRQPIAIVFYPEGGGVPPPVRSWQARNPDWRRPLDQVIVCPVCGISIRAMADFALVEPGAIDEEVARFRDEYLRAACSEHHWPTEEQWAVLESQTG